jgi:hypothetical protein
MQVIVLIAGCERHAIMSRDRMVTFPVTPVHPEIKHDLMQFQVQVFVTV